MKGSKIEVEEYSGILDNTGLMTKRDSLHMFSLLDDMPNYLRECKKLTLEYPVDLNNIQNIVVGGMGGSAMGGHIFKYMLEEKTTVPIEVVSSYTLPRYVSSNTLLVLISYSGNTEETISMLNDGVKKNAQILCITSGGDLKELCIGRDIRYIGIRQGLPPRVAIPYTTYPLLKIASELKWIDLDPMTSETISVIESMRDEALSMKIPFEYNVAKRTALKLMWKYVNIYSSTPLMYPAALRFKTELNENSKILANASYFPEMNHNDAQGWEGSAFMNRSAILFRDMHESQGLKDRIEVTKSIIMNPDDIVELYPKGNSDMARLFSQMYVGDYISLYMAILYGRDPGPVNVVQKVKSMLNYSKLR